MNRMYSPLYYPGVADTGVEPAITKVMSLAWSFRSTHPQVLTAGIEPANLLLVRQTLSRLSYVSIVVAGRVGLPLTAHQTVFLPLKEATISYKSL